MKNRVVEYLREKGKLVSPDALQHIIQQDDPISYAKKVGGIQAKFLTVEEIKKSEEEKPVVEVKRSNSFKPMAKEIDSQLKVFDEMDVTGKSSCEGKIDDFIEYFRDRFERLGGILRMRGGVYKNIDTLKKRKPYDQVRIICMVQSIKTTKNGHRFMEVDDTSDSLNVLIPQSDKKLVEWSSNIVPDEVIAIDGRLSKDLFIAKAIYRPDVPARQEHRAEEDVCVALMSDTHIGSNLFMRKNFEKFLEWINGKREQEELAGKIKYLTIAGDLVDGVGIYPEQQDELETDDIYKQYSELAELLQQIPDYIKIIAIPGNHDAVRVADPQPQINKEVLGPIADLPNFVHTSSPGYVSVHGVEMLLYHGASMHSIVPHVSTVDYEHPEKICNEYLMRRHLHPVYGERPPITPEKKDYLAIERVPDIIQVADIHKNGYTQYKGVVGVNAGCWQNTTPYQIKLGHRPTPCILPIINLKSGKMNVLHFGEK